MFVVLGVGIAMSSVPGMAGVLAMRLMIVLTMAVVMHTGTPHAACAAG